MSAGATTVSAATSTPATGGAASPAYALTGAGVELLTSRGPRTILRDLTFEVGTGEIVGIVGRSGTGKTTLLRMLGGLLAPTAGTVLFEGAAMSGPPGPVVTVFQDYGNALLPWRTVAKNVGLPLESTMSKSNREERVDEALRMVGLEGCRTDYPWRLSGGMQQRVQIARALALKPRVLLMDEPFGALDALTKASMQDELLRVQEQTGSTIVFITHDLEEAIYLSDRVFVIAGSPGHIPVQMTTGLPRPRHQLTTREAPDYLDLRHRLTEAIRDDHAQ